jgi:hypothetical protein
MDVVGKKTAREGGGATTLRTSALLAHCLRRSSVETARSRKKRWEEVNSSMVHGRVHCYAAVSSLPNMRETPNN